MSFYPSGSRCTWVGYFDGSAFSNQNVTDAIQAVSSGLKNKYSLVVERAAPDAGLGSYTSGAIALDLRTDMDRGNGSDGLADIKSNCDDEFTLSGNVASSSRIYTRDGVSTTPTSDNYDSCSGLWDKFQNILPTWAGGTPVTASQQACYTKQGQAQVQTVATNAKTAYGEGSTTAAVAQKTATEQEAMVPGDTAAIADAARKAAATHDNTMLYIALGVGVVVVIIVGVVAIK
jgi:hypothetical protein